MVHATPSALYAHTPNRKWECETKIKSSDRELGCKDIARQLIEDEPGRNINVIMGGGRQCLVSNVADTPADPIDRWSCKSSDGRNLIRDWSIDKEARKLLHATVANNEELDRLNVENVDYVLGKIFIDIVRRVQEYFLKELFGLRGFLSNDVSND